MGQVNPASQRQTRLKIGTAISPCGFQWLSGSVAQCHSGTVTRLLGYSVTRLLGYSVTRLLNKHDKINPSRA
jgi:hypothetical protein